jgi:hypothetical protein
VGLGVGGETQIANCHCSFHIAPEAEPSKSDRRSVAKGALVPCTLIPVSEQAILINSAHCWELHRTSSPRRSWQKQTDALTQHMKMEAIARTAQVVLLGTGSGSCGLQSSIKSLKQKGRALKLTCPSECKIAQTVITSASSVWEWTANSPTPWKPLQTSCI